MPVNVYWIERDGERIGPFDESRIIGDYERGLLRQDDLIWTEGLEEALPLEAVFAQLRLDETLGDGLSLAPIPEEDPYAPPPPAPEPGTHVAPEHTIDDSDEGFLAVSYAGFWVRFGAVTLDTIVVILFTLLLLVIIIFVCGLFGLRLDYTDAKLDLFSFFVAWFYYAGQEGGRHSATLGKRAFHIQVLRAETFAPFGFLRASARYAVSIFSSLILGIGYLIQPFTPRKQALHDLATDCVVVAERPCSTALLVVMLIIGIPIGVAAVIVTLQDLGLLEGII